MLLADSATELGECAVIGTLFMVVTFSCLARVLSNQRCPTKLFDAIAARINAPTSARVDSWTPLVTWIPAGRTPCSRTIFEDVEALGSGFVAAVEERLVAEMLGHRTGRVNIVFIVFTSH